MDVVELRGVVPLTLHFTHDCERWIRGHGESVALLEPRELREWVASPEVFSANTTWGVQ